VSATGWTLPEPGAHATRRAVGEALVRLVRDLQRMPLDGLSPGARTDAQRVLALLGEVSRRSPGLAWSALRRPSVYVHLRLAADRALDPSARTRSGVTTLALELVAGGALTEPLTLAEPAAQVLVRARGTALTLAPSEPARVMPDGEVWQGGRRVAERPAFVPIHGPVALALEDDSPLAALEAHPDKHGSALDLGGASPDAWRASLADALARLERYLPALTDELPFVVSQMVPVGVDPERHLSASYREALGTVYLSLHPDPLTMAEAVLHELQHNKLNAVLTTRPLLENDPEERYTSPVRPDPRPLLGVLLAVHAFVPVAALHLAMRDAQDPASRGARAEARLAQVVRGNEEGLVMLERHARPTPDGGALLAELRALHDATMRRAQPSLA
jgi:HEXXH motif-containing protein